MIEEKLKNTANVGRMGGIQLILIILICYYLVPRPGSVGPSHPFFEEEGKVRAPTTRVVM